MIPRLGEKYNIKIETISKSRTEYEAAEYQETGFPKAPAILIGGKVVVEGNDISEKRIERAIFRHLDLSAPVKAK